ncbi:DUF3570 domain-containing protein [Aquabacterium sp. A7-Y]|uniref:DUF3570 domain-containing protein n=1 Tax=Aquabacterium sp. A7-Y TaxID=1349605 RepID=UPI00223DFCEA|nr:DUF3570 domain-containing protein [Aquabacterium sp. A7-Y]MCW7538586.1 DUF3570 domain-containing protein [Aquabacterium sp. A7-Y]
MAATSRRLEGAAHWQPALRALRAWMGQCRARPRRPGHTTARIAGLLGGALAGASAQAVNLPEDRAEALYHVYDGGGIKASGPALLVRKSMADRVSLSASYYVDAVSNASIDVVTTASPFDERRTEYGLGVDYVYRDSMITLSTSHSKEPDYIADGVSLDLAQDVFGGMTTVNLGFSRGSDKVGRSDTGFFDTARHWRYRLGVTQILTPRWLASLNLEMVSDSGYLGNPYRAAQVFGTLVPERSPRTRSSRAVKVRAVGAIGSGSAVHAEYRYFWDTWDVQAHTAEVGYSRYFGEAWLADTYLRYHTQSSALFYSDNARNETTYVSRNRQLSTFNSIGLGGKVARRLTRVPGEYEIKAHATYEYKRFKYSDFTDLRTGAPYAFNANVFQVYLSATY